MHFLKRYPTELERQQMWKRSETYLRKHSWLVHVECIAALKAAKIKWLAGNFWTGDGGFGSSVEEWC